MTTYVCTILIRDRKSHTSRWERANVSCPTLEAAIEWCCMTMDTFSEVTAWRVHHGSTYTVVADSEERAKVK